MELIFCCVKRKEWFNGKNNLSGTTSLPNNAIQNARQLSRVDKHNYRKYDDKGHLIEFVRGKTSLYSDVQKLYKDEFEKARLEYNSKQTRDDRKIDDYFKKISDNSKNDLACEIIIELGDKRYRDTKDEDFKKKMSEVYKKQVDDLELLVPNFKVASAIIHYDETSPHLHIVGVPIKYKNKNGMEKQVGKSDVFTKTSLKSIQDKMREFCITSFNKTYNLDYTLKAKEEGRNVDINVANMNEYRKFKRQQEKYKKELKELNDKVDKLQDKSNEINNIINNLKPTMMNKNNYTISNTDIDKIKKYIEQTNDTTSNLREANDINVIIKKYEDDLREHSNEVKELKKKITTREDRISDLENRLEFVNDTIDMLEDKVDKLQETLNYFKELWNIFIKFLQDKFFSSNKYDDLIDELHEEEIIDDNDLDNIQNDRNNDKSNDFER